MDKANAVITNKAGEFLVSASFREPTAARAHWTSEYPEAALYTPKEARLVARKLVTGCVHPVSVIIDYGMASQQRDLTFY